MDANIYKTELRYYRRKNHHKACSRELLRSEPRGSEVSFRAEGVWLAFHPDFVRGAKADTPLECSALTSV